MFVCITVRSVELRFYGCCHPCIYNINESYSLSDIISSYILDQCVNV